ncbi:cystatin-B-like [Tubulanus polymorphus]|uniref:cystatin-B-like n=1 Tax=Tubulanus polymorphus TaxID=672921 RepID=UPI003DA255E9
MAMCGGVQGSRAATAEDQDICEKVKDQVQSKTNKSYPTFTATHVATQVVAGTNYFIKVHVGNDEYIHIRVWQKLPPAMELELHETILTGKKESDPIVHFQ